MWGERFGRKSDVVYTDPGFRFSLGYRVDQVILHQG